MQRLAAHTGGLPLLTVRWEPQAQVGQMEGLPIPPMMWGFVLVAQLAAGAW